MGTAYAVGPSNGSGWTASGAGMMGGNGAGMMGGNGAGMMGGNGAGMMGGNGAGMMGGNGAGMMGGNWAAPSAAPSPGQSGFVPGTQSAPRVVRIYAYVNDRFSPETVTVQAGETITFEVTTMGPTTHEFMVGPAADVAADKDGTPEIANIGMMQTKSLTYTFSGTGPFAFACHEPGHYEAGMRGTIVIQ
jgi:plastocyanin